MTSELSIEDLVARFEAGALGAHEFPHARHVRVASALARKYGPDEGFERLVAGIRRILARIGRPSAYHVTMTRAWFELISSVGDLENHDELFDKHLLGRYYSPARLAAGRKRWLPPDIQPLRLPAASRPRGQP